MSSWRSSGRMPRMGNVMIVGEWRGVWATRRKEITSPNAPDMVVYIWVEPTPGRRVYRSPGQRAAYEVTCGSWRVGARSYEHALTLAGGYLRRAQR
jgi:hypothetical protein